MAYPAQIESETLGKQALALAEEKGWDNWSLREFAKHIGVTANALYRYVEDREGLTTLMGEAATRELHRYLQRRDKEYELMEADQVLIDISRRYLGFARRRPHAYSAYFNGKPLPGDPAIQAWLEFWSWLHSKVSAAVPGAEDACAFSLWAYIHGRVELERGPAQMDAKDAGLEDAILAILEGFRAQAPLESPLPDHVRAVTNK